MMDYFKLGSDLVRAQAEELSARCTCGHKRYQHVLSEAKESTPENPLYWCTARVSREMYCICENFSDEENNKGE